MKIFDRSRTEKTERGRVGPAGEYSHASPLAKASFSTAADTEDRMADRQMKEGQPRMDPPSLRGGAMEGRREWERGQGGAKLQKEGRAFFWRGRISMD